MKIALAAAALATLAVGGALAQPSGRGLRDGLYSAAQARRGAALYAESCGQCHGADLAGSYDIPSLRGQLIARWAGTPLAELSDYIQRAMPMYAPGTLGAEANADILAYLLQTNNYPAGARELAPGADLKAVRIEPAQSAAR